MAGNANAKHNTGIGIQEVIEYRVNTSSTNEFYLVHVVFDRETEVRKCNNWVQLNKG